MSTTSNDEIRGDWSNIKGTVYHLRYALWLLLRNQAASTAFYQGNDLVATPSPLTPALLDETSSAVTLRETRDETDVWIQLKATKTEWTLSRLLDGNLLSNFVHNAFHSERQGRTWRASLVTQGLIQRRKLEAFVNSPRSYRDLNRLLTEVINSVIPRLRADGWRANETKPAMIRRKALRILAQLAEAEPVSHDFLESDIERELTLAHPDRELVRQIGDALIGALLRDVAGGPATARAYDAEWLNQAAGRPIVRRGLLDDSPAAACDEAVSCSLTFSGYDVQYFVPRARLEQALEQFIRSDKTLFVLIGMSGAGKSWSCAHWTDATLHGRLRLLIPGTDLDHRRALESLVAHNLRPFTLAYWRDTEFIRRLTTAAERDPLDPLVIVLDDLLPSGDMGVYRRDLARLVSDSRQHKIKLVLTCQRQIWELHRLSEDMQHGDMFVMNDSQAEREQYAAEARVEGSPKVVMNDSQGEREQYAASSKSRTSFALAPDRKREERSSSYMLGDFTPDELRAALVRWLPAGRAKEVADHLRAPAFTPLRNPYLLARYLEQHHTRLEAVNDAPPLDVDALLDRRVDEALNKAAVELTCTLDDLQPAFAALVEYSWQARPEGLKYAQALAAMSGEFPEQKGAALTALRKTALLTVEGTVRFAEPLIADRVFAKRAQEHLRTSEDEFLRELRVESDGGLVVALLRGVAPDPVHLAEKLLEINGEWLSAVAAGLAQTSPDDWRTLALVTTLAVSSEDRSAGDEAYGALGQLAARGNRARKWAAEMYLGDHANQWRHGTRALARLIEYDPERVEAAVRVRLSRILRIRETFLSDREKRMKWLTHDALDPLRGINHSSAAQTGERVIRRYSHLVGRDDRDRHDWDFVDDVDYVRGRIALSGGDEQLAALLGELGAELNVTRYRAAHALRPVVMEKAEATRDAMCTRLGEERDWAVIGRLLLNAYHLIEPYPDELLTTLRCSVALNFSEPLPVTGQVLVLLGNLAVKRPGGVASLLPRRLDAHEAWARAFLTEILAYAWWRCAEHVAEARTHLSALTEPDLIDVPDECIPFVLRGSAIALLAEMCLDQGIPADELTGRQTFYPKFGKYFLYVETVEFFQNHASLLRQHASFERFTQLLNQSLHEEERVQAHPIDRVREAQFRCASMCLELLARTAVLMPDPLPLLNALPRNWQAIRAATRILEMGRTEKAVVRFARESFAGLSSGGTAQAVEERRQCQAQLALLEKNAEQALREQQESALDFFPFSPTSGNALGLATIGAQHPGELLRYLDANARTEKDLPTLYYLVEEARSWQSLLIARIYARMFSSRPISAREATDLCAQMLAAVCALPDSALRQEYEVIYASISSLLAGKLLSVPALPSVPSGASKGSIRSSHELAAEIVKQAEAHIDLSADLTTQLADRRGWWETYKFELRHSLLLQGTACYQMYYLPAVRLALVALSVRRSLSDPAARLMHERWETHEQLRDYINMLGRQKLEGYGAERIERALDAFRAREESAPRDERIPCWLGGLLLRLDRFAEAEAALLRSLSLPTSQGDVRAEALYDLACVYARQNNEAEARRYLMERATVKLLDRNWLAEDADFDSVRGADWFQELIASEAGTPQE